jgi:uncharacterized membrane protein YccC
MRMEPGIIFSLIGAVVTLGGVFIAVGVVKGKINQNDEANRAQAQRIDLRASKEELAAAIKRSDELLELMRKRAEEDRASGEGRYRELYGIIQDHGERIKAVETTQKAIDKSLEEIKSDIKTGFSEMKIELKELRKERKE